MLVHRLVSALETPRTARGLEALGLSAPLIGRDGDLGRMLASLERACEGQAQLVRVTGEAGIGKSRLVAEFLARVHDDERFAKVAVRQVACSPLGEESYGALAAVVRSAGGMGRGESADTIREKLGALLVDLGLEGEAGERLKPLLYHVLGFGDLDAALMHVEPEQLRRQILYAVRTIIERRLAMSPLLIVVEDLHWADAISLEALRFVLDRLERTRLMLVVTHRPDLENDQLESTRVSTTTLRLTPLAEAEGHRLLGTLLGERWVSSFADLRDRILSRAGGNPLFVEEIVRGLIDSGVLQRDGAGWQITSEEAVAGIPANIQAMLLARVDRLPVAVRRVAQDAAVIGPRFDMELLATVSAEPSRLETAIELLCDFELIEEMAGAPAGSRSYRFTQSLLRDVIYQNLLVQRRTEMHGRVGAALERLRGANPERLDDMLMLGHHFGLSANREKGARCLMSAGDRARMIYANADALRHYQQALEALAQSALSPIQLQLNERIADLAGAAGKRKFAREHYRMALDAYRANNQCVDAARILRKTGRLLWDWGKRDQAEAAYSDAAALLEGVDAPVERAHLWQERGRLAFRTGDHARAIIWADEALASAAPLLDSGDAENRSEAALVTAEALNTKAVAFARLGRTGEAVREAEQSVTVAEAAELCGAACRGYTNLGVLYTTIDPLRSIEVCRRGLDVARRIGDLGFQARLLANLAVASCTFTDRCSDEGVPAAEKAIEIDRALDQREHLSVPLIVLGQIHQCNGDPALAGRFYGEALEIARQTGEPQLLFPCYDGLATLNLDMDNLAEADRYFALAQDICAKHGLDPEALVVLPFLD